MGAQARLLSRVGRVIIDARTMKANTRNGAIYRTICNVGRPLRVFGNKGGTQRTRSQTQQVIQIGDRARTSFFDG